MDPSANKDWMHYCVHVRVTLGEGRGDQLSPPHPWTSSLFADIFQECLKEKKYQSHGLCPLMKAILFFGRQSLKEGLPHGKARNVAFSMAGPVIWARRWAQVKMTVNMVQKWMQGIKEDGSEVELRNGRVQNCKSQPRNAWSQNVRRGEKMP